MKIKLVKNWKKLHKSFTVIVSVIGSIVGLLEVVLPHLGILQATLDPITYGYIMFSITVFIAIGRYIQQDYLQQSSAEEKDNGDVG